MEQKEIDRIIGLMRNRDHLGLLKVEEQLMVLRSLADEVPGLLAEVMKERDAVLLQSQELQNRVETLVIQLDLTAEWLEAQESAAAQDIAKRVRIAARSEGSTKPLKRVVPAPNDKSGGDAARCGKCGRFYVDHVDDGPLCE